MDERPADEVGPGKCASGALGAVWPRLEPGSFYGQYDGADVLAAHCCAQGLVAQVQAARTGEPSTLGAYEIGKLQNLADYANRRLVSLNGAQISRQDYFGIISGLSDLINVSKLLTIETQTQLTSFAATGRIGKDIVDFDINMLGGNVPSRPAVAGVEIANAAVSEVLLAINHYSEAARTIFETLAKQAELLKEKDKEVYSEFNELLELLKELGPCRKDRDREADRATPAPGITADPTPPR